MRKIIMVCSVLALSIMFQVNTLSAQSVSGNTTTTVKLDEATQQQVDMATAQLAKDQEQLTKESAKYEKEKAKFDAKKAKMTPAKKAKAQEGLNGVLNEMGKLKERIATNQALVEKYKQ